MLTNNAILIKTNEKKINSTNYYVDSKGNT